MAEVDPMAFDDGQGVAASDAFDGLIKATEAGQRVFGAARQGSIDYSSKSKTQGQATKEKARAKAAELEQEVRDLIKPIKDFAEATTAFAQQWALSQIGPSVNKIGQALTQGQSDKANEIAGQIGGVPNPIGGGFFVVDPSSEGKTVSDQVGGGIDGTGGTIGTSTGPMATEGSGAVRHATPDEMDAVTAVNEIGPTEVVMVTAGGTPFFRDGVTGSERLVDDLSVWNAQGHPWSTPSEIRQPPAVTPSDVPTGDRPSVTVPPQSGGNGSVTADAGTPPGQAAGDTGPAVDLSEFPSDSVLDLTSTGPIGPFEEGSREIAEGLTMPPGGQSIGSGVVSQDQVESAMQQLGDSIARTDGTCPPQADVQRMMDLIQQWFSQTRSLPGSDVSDLADVVGETIGTDDGDVPGLFQSTAARCAIDAYMSGDAGADAALASNSFFADLLGSIGGPVGLALRPVGGMLDALMSMVGAAVGCTHPVANTIMIKRLILGVLSQWVAPAINDVAIGAEYAYRSKCPSEMPTASEAIAMNLAGLIDDDLFENLVSINNKCPDPQKVVRDAAQAKMTPDELLQLYRRGLIDDAELDRRLRLLGFTDQQVYQHFRDLSVMVPPMSELIRYMVRDAADAKLVAQQKLDEDFDKKFAGPIKDWAKSQGISEEFMRMTWRSHWSIPSYGQLTTMYHRSHRWPKGDSRHVTLDEVRDALKQDDYAPRFIDPLIAITFRPLTLRDVRRAFEIGAVTIDEVERAYRDLGYSEENAAILKRFVQKLRDRQLQRHDVIAKFRLGRVTEADAIAKLKREGASDEGADKAIESAIDELDDEAQMRCIKAVQRRYTTGEMEIGDARDALAGLGIRGRIADARLRGWECERRTQVREEPISRLMRWTERGAMTFAQLNERLTRIGVAEADRMLYLGDVRERIDARLGKEADARRRQLEKLGKQQLAAELRAERAAESSRKNLEKANEARRKKAEREQKQSANRRKLLAGAASKHAKKVGGTADAWAEVFEAVRERLRTRLGLDIDNSYRAVAIAVTDRPKDSDVSIEQWIEDVAIGMIESSGSAE